MTAKEIQEKLEKLADAERAKASQGFFKTGEGQYGEGDIFRGIRVPALRALTKEYKRTPLPEIEKLLHSQFHEDRLLALMILVGAYSKADEAARKRIYEFYLSNTKRINNWDMVDASAEFIVGPYLADKSKDVLYQLARSDNLWERRIAILSTFHYIKQRKFDEPLKIAEMLLSDKEDLIHKAVGWMLREVGNRDLKTEEEFLQKHYMKMPRTMLRYAIEKFPEPTRQMYLKGKI